MDVNSYCENLTKELGAWKQKVEEIVQRVDKLSSGDKGKVLDQVNDLHALIEQLEDRIERLKNECPAEWSPDKIEIAVTDEGDGFEARGHHDGRGARRCGRHRPARVQQRLRAGRAGLPGAAAGDRRDRRRPRRRGDHHRVPQPPARGGQAGGSLRTSRPRAPEVAGQVIPGVVPRPAGRDALRHPVRKLEQEARRIDDHVHPVAISGDQRVNQEESVPGSGRGDVE